MAKKPVSINQKVNGMKQGLWISHFANGSKRSEGRFKAGKKHGKWVLYHPNGAVQSEANFHEGLYTGPYASYHENGAPFRVGLYNDIRGDSGDGRKEGVWHQYSLDGVVEWQVTYRRGKVVERLPFPESQTGHSFEE